MNKEQYTEMLKNISETHKQGGNISACIAKYNKLYKYMYIYNDNIFKILFGNPENEKITIDFLNAILNLYGSDCIEHVTFVNPAVPSAIGKTITSDIVAENQHLDRIVLEVQHVCGDSYRDRLVLYTAKHTVASRIKGDDYKLRNLNLISLQMFNGFPESSNYRHTIRLKNQDNEVYFDKQTITLVEIPKFLTGKYATDNSRLAEWLRVIDGLNKDNPITVPKDSPFYQLQEKAKLSIFTEEFLVSEAMKMSDHNYELYVEKKQARAEGLAEGLAEGKAEGLAEGKAEGLAEGKAEGLAEGKAEMAKAMLVDGDSVEKVMRISKMTESEVLAIQAELTK